MFKYKKVVINSAFSIKLEGVRKIFKKVKYFCLKYVDIKNQLCVYPAPSLYFRELFVKVLTLLTTEI